MKHVFRKVFSTLTSSLAPPGLRASWANIFTYMFALALALPSLCWAWAAPQQGTFGFRIYDFAVNTLLHGGLGNVICMGILAFGIWAGINSRLGGWGTGAPAIIFSGILYNLDAVSQTLGFIV